MFLRAGDIPGVGLQQNRAAGHKGTGHAEQGGVLFPGGENREGPGGLTGLTADLVDLFFETHAGKGTGT